MQSFLEFHSQGLKSMSDRSWWGGLWSWEAAAVYGAWYIWTVVCWAVLPGQKVEGAVLRDGKKLMYTMNGA
jgi:delta14-sterol reductase